MESERQKKHDEPLTDSPWFWTYIFATAGLIALALASHKFGPRQTQLERQFLARQAGGQTVKGNDGTLIEPPRDGNLIVTLGPLVLICAGLLVVAWARFWWTRTEDAESKPHSSSEESEHSS